VTRTPRGGHIPGRSARRGFALVLVIWALSLLALLAASYGGSSRGDAIATIRLADRIEAKNLARAAIERGIFELMRERAWKTDGTAYDFQLGEADLSVAIWSERGKVDLNAGSPSLLRPLLVQAGATESEIDALIDGIEDWKDGDDLKRLNGAEAEDYRAAGRPSGPANKPFESIERLQQLLGISPEIYRRLLPRITVHSFTPAIDPRSAPEELLRAVPGIDPVSLEEFLATREKRKYDDPSEPLPILSAPGSSLAADAGRIFTVRGTAVLPTGVTVAREVVVWIENRSEGRFWVLDARSEAS